jgi:uncharacterized protein with PQ loop repeat
MASAEINNTISYLISEAVDGKYFDAKVADTFWLMICGFLVFFMQCGFALLEAGTVRAKNTKNILMKNVMDACIGAIIWWSVGYLVAVRPSFPPSLRPPCTSLPPEPERRSLARRPSPVLRRERENESARV